MMMRSIFCFILLLHLCVGCATFGGCQKSNPFAAATTTPTDEESLTEPRPPPSASCLGSESNCRIEPLKIRFGREKHPWHDEEDEDREEQADDDDDDDEAAAEHERCGAALLQGLRPSQEDRILCVPDIPLPTFGSNKHDGPETKVSLFAVFDGHGGDEASELASEVLYQNFIDHLYQRSDGSFLLQSNSRSATPTTTAARSCLPLPAESKDMNTNKISCEPVRLDSSGMFASAAIDSFGYNQMPENASVAVAFEHSALGKLLKDSLANAISDIDATFSAEARKDGLQAGTTACVVLQAADHLLIANLGDSKAILCPAVLPPHDTHQSKRRHKRRKNNFVGREMHVGVSELHGSLALELTDVHRPDREDERLRVEANGGFVENQGGVPRVNGQLAVSRSIGDVALKKYGVTAEPEWTGWLKLDSQNYSHLIIASDGVFEKLTTDDICRVSSFAETTNVDSSREVVPARAEVSPKNMAQEIVDAAYLAGSMDNLAALVVPLHPRKFFDKYEFTEDFEDMVSPTVESLPPGAGHTGMSFMIKVFVCWFVQQFKVVILLAKVATFKKQCCHFISYSIYIALYTGVAGGTLEVYREHLVCTPLKGSQKEVCLRPEGLSQFLRLIGSVPLDRQGLLYMLKKNFARGSFGEIWLGVRRPCWRDVGGKMEFLAGSNTSSTSSHRETFQAPQDSCSMLGAKIYNEEGGTSSKQWTAGDLSGYADDMFILKRILVEKGASAYLSGLREKHFGQIFLNESLAARERAAKPAGHHLHDPVLAHDCANFRTSFWNPFCYSKRTVVIASGNGSHPEYESGAGLAHIARYVESLEMPGKQEFWLVFHNEGQSLASLLYTAGTGGKAEDDDGELGGFKVVQPSPWWRWLKTTDAGRTEMRSIMHQLLLAVKECHDHNITHRDIKPGNMIVRAERDHVSDWPSNLTMRIIDFGSAVDRFTLKHLYGPSGTSQAEQTAEYAPPEANLGKHWMHFHPDQAYMYDLWSVGVVMLELVLGTPHVFQISTRTRALLDHRLQGMDASAREMIYLLRAFLEMCILLPGIPPQHHHHHHTETLQQSEEVRLAAWECTEEAFMQQIKQRDPLGMGMPDVWALRLVRRLLQWYPQDRISAAEALQHPFFHPSLQDDPRKL
ncbi:unnamed protein product [Sphagnum troendelagicum]|uniref:protein-serine/threonine phosphatase n=1 Tax=Sphagnum troendelagicum TaxID=128251 RepID=A0ABP0UYP3_9BRYO